MTDANQRTKTLLISHDIVGESMAGPGIRYYHLARVLAKHVDTALAVPEGSTADFPDAGFEVVHYTGGDWSTLEPHVAQARTCIFPSAIADGYPQLTDSGACLVVDGYDPLLAEWLELPAGHHAGRFTAEWQKLMLHLGSQYAMGDFFLCASERQRDWWLGLLEANGRINPATHGADHSLRNLIDVVAYGMPENSPIHKRKIIKGVWAGINEDDKVLVWGGGLWPWLDPVTAIRAVGRVSEQRDDVRLIFPGTRHPNPILADMPTRLADAVRTAEKLGLTDKSVFFGDWVPYEDWSSLLLESDLALILHLDTLETRLAFRSRVLEYIWCSLPTVSTTGDATSELIKQYDLGQVVGYDDVDAVADAISMMLEEPIHLREPLFVDARSSLTWEKTAEPLIRYCQDPKPAADKAISNADGDRVYFASPWDQLRQERRYYQGQIEAYESGRFIRTMKWVNKQLARVRSGSASAEQVANGGRRVTHLHKDGAFYAQLAVYTFAAELCQGANVIDVGCGDGYGAHYLISNGASSVRGIDTDPQAVSFSQHTYNADRLAFDHHDAERLDSYPTESADVILAINVLEYIFDLDAFLDGTCHVLKPDGTLIVSVLPATDDSSGQSNSGGTVTSAWSAQEWHGKLSSQFANVQCYTQSLRDPTSTDITSILHGSPQNTTIDETDFTFAPSTADIDEVGMVNAVFVCTNGPHDTMNSGGAV